MESDYGNYSVGVPRPIVLASLIAPLNAILIVLPVVFLVVFPVSLFHSHIPKLDA